jgi:hypothetical protein
MRLAFLIAALAGVLFSNTVLAAEPSFCHSVCDSERRACKADVLQRAAEDDPDYLTMPERNQFARTAAASQGQPEAARASERSAAQNRRIAREGACENTYQRCERACKAPQDKAAVSPIFTPRKSG